MEHGGQGTGAGEDPERLGDPVLGAGDHVDVLAEQERRGRFVGGGRLGRVPDDVHQRQVVVANRVGVDREAASLDQLVLGAQVDHGAQPEAAQELEVGLGQPVQAIGPEQGAPDRSAARAGRGSRPGHGS